MSQSQVMNDFSDRIKNNINDAFYVEGISWEGKIKTLRTYTEIILRFILDDENCRLTLGDKVISKRIEALPFASDFLANAIKKINSYGNDNIHTYKLSAASQEDFESALDALYDLYAFLFINYFMKNGISTKNRVLGIFSLLPPIVRKKTFEYIWSKNKENPVVIDKLCLAMLKSDGKGIVNNWIEQNKETLQKVPCRTPESIEDLIKRFGNTVAEKIILSGPQNMYEVCLDKVRSLEDTITKYGPLYQNYEEALYFYEDRIKSQYKNLNSDEQEFIILMDFCYKGRKSINNGKNQLFYSIGNIRSVLSI